MRRYWRHRLNRPMSSPSGLAALPEVSRTLTLNSFIPCDQEQKIAALKAASRALARRSIPEAAARADAIRRTSPRSSGAPRISLQGCRPMQTSADADAARHVVRSAQASCGRGSRVRAKAEAAIVPPLIYDLDRLRKSLTPEPVTIQDAAAQLWSATGCCPMAGRAFRRCPKGDPNDINVLRKFATAVLHAEPSAAGTAISYYESGRDRHQGIYRGRHSGAGRDRRSAVRRIAAGNRCALDIGSAAARRRRDAGDLRTRDLALNFANIIALPLLLGVGVAFKIYYIMAWRAGKTGLLQSTLTRAVVFSAMTNAVAFGSMWSSSYPGMSSMGKMMALALLCTMAAAVLFQPVLMGRPRQIIDAQEEPPPDLRQAAE